MIIENLINENNLTETEKHLAHYLLDKNNDLEGITSTELGKRSFTSQPAVTRLYKKLGLKTFREFISILLLERNEYFKIRDFSFQSPISFCSSYEETQKTISVLYAQIITRTNLLIDKNMMVMICNRILNATSVDIYGMGMNDTLAKQFHFQLQSLGIYSVYQNGFNLNYIKNMQNQFSNVSIFIQLSELSTDTLHILNELKKKNIYTVGIMGKKYKDLNICQDVIVFDDNMDDELGFMCSFFAAEYIINVIFSMLLYRYQKI